MQDRRARDLERAVAAVRAAALAVARLGDPTSFAAMAALGVSAQ